METLLFWGVPLAFALFGFQRLLYRAFTKFICFAFAIYLAMWSEGMVGGWIGSVLPSAISSLIPMIAIYATAVLVFIVLVMLMSSLNPRGNVYYFPKVIDRLGGLLFGFLTGMILIGFLGTVACLTPLKNDLPLRLSTESVQNRSVAIVMGLTGAMNAFSFQPSFTETSGETLKTMLIDADKAAEEFAAKRKEYEARQRKEQLKEEQEESRPGAIDRMKHDRDEKNEAIGGK